MQHKGGFREPFLDLRDQVDLQALATGFVSEFDRAVAGTDGDGESVCSSASHELLRLAGVGVDDFFQDASEAGLGTTDCAELALDTYTTLMSYLDYRLGDRHIRLEVVGVVIFS